MTLPEVLLWKILKQRPNGLKFRRQHPYGKRIVMDFYCAERRLDIEIDGKAHDLGERRESDERRDAFLASQDIQVVRFPATEVLKDVDNSVISFCAAMPPPSALRAATSPKGGGSIGIA
jgi:very-short-patch-repair endonuclease